MKIWRFLSNNFFIVNFFITSLIVGLLFGRFYLPNVNQFPLESKSTQPLPVPIASGTPTVENSPQNINIVPTPRPQPRVEVLSPLASPSLPKPNNQPSLPELPPENLDDLAMKPSRSERLPRTESNNYLGHFAFVENSRKNLVKIGKYYDRNEYLDREAAQAFTQMTRAAEAQGIQLIIISGFRSVNDQSALFQRQIQRKGSQQAAAQYSAPPGYSEHHTGLALDIGDGQNPSADLKVAFEQTSAFQWLVNNAYQYGFELSFPPNNPQGVSYEPWHWRYVASPRASQIFASVREFP